MNFRINYLFICLLLIGFVVSGCGGGGATKISADAAVGNATAGEKLFAEKGCIACHTVAGDQVKLGPSLVGVVGRSDQIIAQANFTGQAKTAEAYLFESITQPDTYVTEGYTPIMPKTYGSDLTEQELADLVSYLLTLK